MSTLLGVTDNPGRMFLAQLIDAPAVEVRRTAIPSEVFGQLDRPIYRAIRSVSHDHAVVTAELVVSELREVGKLDMVGGPDAVHALAGSKGFHTIDGARADLVDEARARLLMEAAKASHSHAKAGKTREATDGLRNTLRLVDALSGGGDVVQVKSMSDHIRDWAERVRDEAGKTRVPPADLGAFRDAFGDFTPGALGLIYGFSQTGKSFVMQWMESRYAAAGHTTLRLSIEDPDRLNASRLVSEASGVDCSKPSTLTHDDWGKIMRIVGKDADEWDRRFVVEHPSSVETAAHTIRRMATDLGVSVAFVDYAQLLRVADRHDSAEQRLSAATAMLKEVAKECGVQLWLGSQVTVRDPKKVNKPSPFDLKGARSIYEMAEVGIALWWDSDGCRYAEVQKDKIGGSSTVARVESGKGGVITDMVEADPPGARRSGGQQFTYGGASEFRDPDDFSAGRGF